MSDQLDMHKHQDPSMTPKDDILIHPLEMIKFKDNFDLNKL